MAYQVRRTDGFNPRAREGRDYHVVHDYPGGSVSIHAPARGATQPVRVQAGLEFVSIHAPARGATTGLTMCILWGYRFNPRAREGRDLAHYSALFGGLAVSIHAPARGATRCGGATGAMEECFNPRAREGRDSRLGNHRRGAACFNPRAREGRDKESKDDRP